ncbi:MAG TPA: ABC transporter permease, partial [Myxococcaceae bacterium]
MTSSDLDSSSKRNPLVGLVEGVGNSVLSVFRTVGGVATLGVSVLAWTFRPPLRLQNIFTQFDFVGVGSIVLVALTGTFSGMVFATQSWSAFEL